jgi:hypothetical protein
MTELALLEAARKWVADNYAYNSYHLIDTLAWLDRLAPGATAAMRLAALTHDMERAFPGPDQPVARGFVDAEYYAAHAARSARIVGAWLRENGATADLTEEVEKLVRAHEAGGWPEADLVQAADSISLLSVNVELFLNMVRSGKRSAREVREKFHYSYDRIRIPEAKPLAAPLLESALARLEALAAQGQPV